MVMRSGAISIVADSVPYIKQGFMSYYRNTNGTDFTVTACYRKHLYVNNSELTLFTNKKYDAYIYAFAGVQPTFVVKTGVFLPDITEEYNYIKYRDECNTWERWGVPSRYTNEILNTAFLNMYRDILTSGLFEYPIEPEVLNDFSSFYYPPGIFGYKDIAMATVMLLNGKQHTGDAFPDCVTYIPLGGIWGWLIMGKNDILEILKMLNFPRSVSTTGKDYMKDKIYQFLSLLTLGNNSKNSCALSFGDVYSDYSNLW